jgi:hypothetical protein
MQRCSRINRSQSIEEYGEKMTFWVAELLLGGHVQVTPPRLELPRPAGSTLRTAAAVQQASL